MTNNPKKSKVSRTAKSKAKRVENLLKKIKVHHPTSRSKKDSEVKGENKKNNIILNNLEESKDEEFNEKILEEDIGFTAPVITEISSINETSSGGFSLEETASEFIPENSQTTKIDNGLDYAGKKTGRNYSGSGDYALGGSALYSGDVQSFNPLGGNIDSPLVPNKNLMRKSDIINPFGEERTRGDTNWATQASELEHFTKLQQQEELEKEKKKRQSSQFA